jgi:hypothetical protein
MAVHLDGPDVYWHRKFGKTRFSVAESLRRFSKRTDSAFNAIANTTVTHSVTGSVLWTQLIHAV